jgi:hypothetical protein
MIEEKVRLLALMWLLPQVGFVILYLIPYLIYFHKDYLSEIGFEPETPDE